MTEAVVAATEERIPARTPGAHRAQKGEFVFNFDKVNQILGGPDYSPVFGGCVEGDRMIVALMTAPAGKRSEPHSHPNEQWIFVLEGDMELVVDGQTHTAHPGEVIYIPANTVHCGSTPEGGKDAKFFTVKDASWGLHGIKAKA
ncbi:MAG: cupin domain-containing protein [Burkholderiales bacterium]|nr:cupin domain-containing protein [Burkholderiales bacterium]